MAKKKIDLGYTPSTYQQNVFDFVQHGTGNAVISALAGSGKTTVIVSAYFLHLIKALSIHYRRK